MVGILRGTAQPWAAAAGTTQIQDSSEKLCDVADVCDLHRSAVGITAGSFAAPD